LVDFLLANGLEITFTALIRSSYDLPSFSSFSDILNTKLLLQLDEYSMNRCVLSTEDGVCVIFSEGEEDLWRGIQ
jgi:hypothetical protein